MYKIKYKWTKTEETEANMNFTVLTKRRKKAHH